MPKSTRVNSGKFYVKHPQGRKSVGIDRTKYAVIKSQIISALKDHELTHTELLETVSKKMKSRFDGSIAWYLEWVKLDLEGRKQIKRNPRVRPETFTLK